MQTTTTSSEFPYRVFSQVFSRLESKNGSWASLDEVQKVFTPLRFVYAMKTLP